MKLINKFLTSFLTIAVGFYSCKKDEVGGTATRDTAGEWYVIADAVKADGSLVTKDVRKLGHFKIGTYNTVQNTSDKMWVDDYNNFWKFKGKVDLDLANMSFSGKNIQNASTRGDAKITFDITNGKVLKGVGRYPNGTVADSIVFEVKFSNDNPVGYDHYRISGVRYSGLEDND
ncbi:lipid-binding protein [Sphingobacterium sp. Ag1]|uniref:lipid-binding protein n=1 Tax=Sphingobacterium sp. Ag1 TaxID=1643451 RepID=UPI00069B2157|nr:lipid-binding protein [Sphingobacterium sp. Ag1]